MIANCVDGLGELIEDGVTGFLIEAELPIESYPSFGSTLNSIPEYVYDPVKDCLSPPRLISPEKLAEKILRLVDDSELYREMSRKAREMALTHFSFDKYVQRLNSVLCSYAS